jgi:hypothetical protein
VLKLATNFREFADVGGFAAPPPALSWLARQGEENRLWAKTNSSQLVNFKLSGLTTQPGMEAPVIVPQKIATDGQERLMFAPFGSSHADGDFVGLFFQDGASTTASTLMVSARQSDPISTITLYSVSVQQPSVGSFKLQIVKTVSGISTNLGTNQAISITNTKAFYVRFNLQGSALKAKCWQFDVAEPATPQVSITDTSITTAGFAGILLGQNTTAGITNSCCWFAASSDPSVPAPLYQGA